MNFGVHHSLHNHLDGLQLIENLLSLPTFDLFLIEAEKWPDPVWYVKIRYWSSKEVLLDTSSQLNGTD